jgi:hypothetical protein
VGAAHRDTERRTQHATQGHAARGLASSCALACYRRRTQAVPTPA